MTNQPDHATSVHMRTLGVVQSCFKEKFGIPRQPGLVPSARARIRIHREFALEDAFAGLEHCSHIWVQFIFHESVGQWQPKVRPPRLGGNKKLGVFASRSPNRPNALGLSVVSLRSIEKQADALYLNISGGDLLDGTPVLDIKPYLPYADVVSHAVNAIAPAPPQLHSVHFSETAELFCRSYRAPAEEMAAAPPDLQALIIEILQQDPRPQYQALDETRVYGMRLLNLNVRWQYQQLSENPDEKGPASRIKVLDVTPV